MGNLCCVSFNGIDSNTNLLRLSKIQKRYPFAEFGVILSKNWRDNGNRYWNPDELHKLAGYGLNLSAHLCGNIARNAIKDKWKPAEILCDGYFSLFKRCQLNIASNDKNPKILVLDNIPLSITEVIIQQKNIDNCSLFEEYYHRTNDDRVSVLMDSSGGLGINSDIVPITDFKKVGYAGGINPDNVVEKTTVLLESSIVRNFWVDMESGVRSGDVSLNDDWFDLDKVEDVCEKVDKLLLNHIN